MNKNRQFIGRYNTTTFTQMLVGSDYSMELEEISCSKDKDKDKYKLFTKPSFASNRNPYSKRKKTHFLFSLLAD